MFGHFSTLWNKGLNFKQCKKCDWMEEYNKRNELGKSEANVYKGFLYMAFWFLPLHQWKLAYRDSGNMWYEI